MKPDFRALCAELVEYVERLPLEGALPLVDRTRAALSQPAPEPQTDDEIATLISWLLERATQAADMGASVSAGKFTLAAQLLGEQWGQS
jgi:hypothetical protein